MKNNNKEQLKTIQNDIENIDKAIENSIDEDTINYLKSIKKDLKTIQKKQS